MIKIKQRVGPKVGEMILYGEVTDERIAREKAILRHRLENLVEWKKPDEMELFVDEFGDAYPVIFGKIQWDYWRRPVEN